MKKTNREFFGRELPKNYSFYERSDWNEKRETIADPTPLQMIVIVLLVLAPIIYHFFFN